MQNKNELTIRERAAALLFVHGIETSPAKLYAVAYRDSLEAVEALSDISGTASRWIRSKRMREFIQKEAAALDSKREQERKGMEAEIIARLQAKTDRSLDGAGLIDYSLPANQLRKLNALINGSKDAGEALDALKVMIAKQTELAPEKKTEKPVRFYRPFCCSDCPLYSMAGEVLQQRAAQNYNNHAPAVQAEIDAKLREGGRAIIEKYYQMLIKKSTLK